MATDWFYQCKITQPCDGGHKFDVVWLPERYAKLGKWLRIDSRDGNWKVAEVWGRRPKGWVFGRERDHTKQRGVSDI